MFEGPAAMLGPRLPPAKVWKSVEGGGRRLAQASRRYQASLRGSLKRGGIAMTAKISPCLDWRAIYRRLAVSHIRLNAVADGPCGNAIPGSFEERRDTLFCGAKCRSWPLASFCGNAANGRFWGDCVAKLDRFCAAELGYRLIRLCAESIWRRFRRLLPRIGYAAQVTGTNGGGRQRRT